MSLFKEAMSDVGVSVEEFQDIPADATLVEETVVSPTDSPSATIPVDTAAVEPQAPVEEVIAVPVTEVIEAPEAVVENTIAEHEQLQDKAEQIVALQMAMEEFSSIVRSTGFSGLDPVAAKMLRVQMREASRVLGITTKIGSMESFALKGAREQHELATVSLEDIRAAGKKALAQFLEIVERIINFIKRSGQNFFDGVINVERVIDQLITKLDGIKDAGGGDGSWNAPPILMQDGKPNQTVSPDIQGLAHFAAYAYPEAIVKFFDGVTKGVLKFDADGAGNEELEGFFATYSKPLQFLIEQQANKDSLPGGFVLDVSENALSIGIKPGESTPEVAKLKVLRTVELRKVVRDLKALVTQLKEIRPESEKISKAGSKLVEAAKRAMSKGGSENEAIYNEMATRVGKMVQEASPRSGEIVDYLIKYIKAQCVSVNTQIKMIESPVGKEPGKSEAGKSDSGKAEAGESEEWSTPSPELDLGYEFGSTAKFVEEYKTTKNVSIVRSSIRLTLNYKGYSYEDIMGMVRKVEKVVPDLWEPFEVKAGAREIDKNEADWTEDYFDKQFVYLKTNFSKERFKHCTTVAQYLGLIK